MDIIRPAIGMMAHEALVYPDLTPRETLRMMARAYELKDAEGVVQRAIEAHGLKEVANRPARTFSRGQLQRLALARTLLHEPDLVLLDEPTTGLDQASTERLVRAMEAMREGGKIVVLVTHDAALSERVADRRVHLERGRVVRDTKRTALGIAEGDVKTRVE